MQGSVSTPGAPRLLLLAFTPFPAPTGLATRLAQRIIALSNAGYALEVLTPRSPKLPHVSALGSARIFRVPMPSLGTTEAEQLDRRAAFERAVKRQLQSFEYDAVHALDAAAANAVIDCHDDAKIIYEIEPAAKHDRLLEGANAVIAPTDWRAGQLSADGVDHERLQVLRPSADLELYRPALEQHDWSASIVQVAVVAGRLSSDEVTQLIQAMHAVPTSCRVRVLVSAEVSAADRKRVDGDDNLRRRLTLRDPVFYDDLVPLYSECQVGVILGGPRLQALAEMMASGMACIAPDLPEVREVARPEAEAMLVTPNDALALSRAIQTIANDSKLRERLGNAARLRAEAELSDRKTSSRLLALYDSLLVGDRPHGPDSIPPPDRSVRLKIDSLLQSVSSASDQAARASPDATAREGSSRPKIMPITSDDITLPGEPSPFAKEDG